MARYTPTQVYTALRNNGLTTFQATTFLAIAWRESGGTFDTSAHNGNVLTLDDSYGIFQINFFGGIHRDTTKECAMDLDCSIKYAIKLYKNRGNKWSDWYVYTDAQAKTLAHWNDAVKVAQAADASGAFTNPATGGTLTPGNDQSTPGSITLPGVGTVGLPFNPQNPLGLPSQADLADLVKEIALVGVWFLIGFTLIAFGVWGLARDSGATDAAVSGVKKAARTFIPGAGLVV